MYDAGDRIKPNGAITQSSVVQSSFQGCSWDQGHGSVFCMIPGPAGLYMDSGCDGLELATGPFQNLQSDLAGSKSQLRGGCY